MAVDRRISFAARAGFVKDCATDFVWRNEPVEHGGAVDSAQWEHKLALRRKRTVVGETTAQNEGRENFAEFVGAVVDNAARGLTREGTKPIVEKSSGCKARS